MTPTNRINFNVKDDGAYIFGYDSNNKLKVGIVKTEANYPFPPFSPSNLYPEYIFGYNCIQPNNYVYEAVRNLFVLLGLDKDNLSKSTWNPLSGIIVPGDRVLIKPNFVNSYHLSGGDITCLITHGSVIRAVIDYVIIALNGEGCILIADSSERMADFKEILKISQTDKVLEFYQSHNRDLGNINIEVRDLRREKIKYGYGAIAKRNYLKGDPEGYTVVDLGNDSEFTELTTGQLKRLYGADYNRRETIKAHNIETNKYEIANTVLNSDVIISIPKLKTHYRVGTTLNTKGFVGTTGNKNFIPHRTLGDPTNGGDTYMVPPSSWREKGYRKLSDFLKDNLLGYKENTMTAIIYSFLISLYNFLIHPSSEEIKYIGGCWYGNDTCWRSTIDIARIIYYCDKNGILRNVPQRRFFSIIDGIIGGEGDGPTKASSKPAGCIIGGTNLIAVDIIATLLMGFDYRKLKYLIHIQKKHNHNLSVNLKDINVESNIENYKNILNLTRKETLCFNPPQTWKGQMELEY